jgi:transcriptional regulator with XRE-family HTH domain
MVIKMDKRQRAAIFRQRLSRAMEVAQSNRSGLAREIGIDRSTISQLLGGDDARLPNAQIAADCASALGVSTDWLLGLTERPERPGDVIAAAMTVTEAARSSSDDQLLAWHQEAVGYKIRHVPATMPDMLKTEAVLKWEYGDFLSKTTDQAIGAMRDRIDWFRSSGSDYEIAAPIHEFESFARGDGYYHGLDATTRREQLDRISDFCADLYPSLRLFLFDAMRVFSAPITLFGPLIGVIYVGRFYLAFRESARVKLLTQHFDWLVREAEVDAREAATFVARLRDDIG